MGPARRLARILARPNRPAYDAQSDRRLHRRPVRS